jgi:PIN domain nuclease of toxin-antitoxin system
VRLLLDSHVVLWWFEKPTTLHKDLLPILSAADNELFFSAASWWELGIKRALRRIQFDPAVVSSKMDETYVQRLSVTFAHAEAAAALPLHHADPFDRMLIAQASTEGLVLATRDKAFRAYGISLVKA